MPAPARAIAASLLACALVASPWTWVVCAESDAQVIEQLATTGPRDAAIARGLDFLRQSQHPDGSVGATVPVAVSALAVMAHLAAGYAPDDRQHGAWIRRAIGYVLASQDVHGYFGGRDHSRMYGHGICTLALAEALGMCRDEELDERIRTALERAVAVTVGAARLKRDPANSGGWHYTPDDDGADLSLSGWQLLSLHACEQVGIAVPPEVISAGVAYARRLTTADGRVGYNNPNEDHPPLRGLGLLCLAIGHQLDAAEVGCIAERIRADPIQWGGSWLFYRAYYDAVGLSRAAPEQWTAYAPILEKLLIEHQQPDGSWHAPPGDDEGDQGGPQYMTSMALLALCVERHVLPAYQR